MYMRFHKRKKRFKKICPTCNKRLAPLENVHKACYEQERKIDRAKSAQMGRATSALLSAEKQRKD